MTDSSELTQEELLLLLRKTETANSRLERLLRSSQKQLELYKSSVEAQVNFSKLIKADEEKESLYNRLLLRYCPDIIFILDNELKFILGTDNMEKIIGISDKGVLVGRDFASITEKYFTKSSEIMKAINTVASVKNTDAREVRLNVFEGGINYNAIVRSFLDDNQEFAGVVFLLHDTTELENLVDGRTHELKVVTLETKRAAHAISQFFANISHELISPINTIIGISDQLLLDQLNDKQCQYVNDIKISSASLLGIINDIMSLTKIEKN